MANATIENAAFKLTVAPYLGGRIVRLYYKHRQRDILMPVQTLAPEAIAVHNRIISGGSYPLAPYSNRIRDASFIWNGRTHTLPVSAIAKPHAIHGAACYTAWHVEARNDHSITLVQHHTAGDLWGFDFTLRQHFTLTETRLINTLSFTNMDTVHQPIGLGFHPFFNAQGLKTVQVHMQGMWQSKNCIPLHKQALPAAYDFCTAKPFVQAVDNLFYGVDSPCIADYGTYTVTVTSTSQNAVLFSNDVDTFFCFEPVENVTNAHNMQPHTSPTRPTTYALKHGLTALAPSHTHTFSMTITVTEK